MVDLLTQDQLLYYSYRDRDVTNIYALHKRYVTC
jgi:hypothetical protein